MILLSNHYVCVWKTSTTTITTTSIDSIGINTWLYFIAFYCLSLPPFLLEVLLIQPPPELIYSTLTDVAS